MISGEMAVVNIPKQTIETKSYHSVYVYVDIVDTLYYLLESIFITAIAERAPKNTAIRGFWIDIIDVMKNVLSPNSEAVIKDDDARNEFQNELATEYGVMFNVCIVVLNLPIVQDCTLLYIDWIDSISYLNDTFITVN